jgi:hypothetical protein
MIILSVRALNQIFDYILSRSIGKLGKELKGLVFSMFSKGILISGRQDNIFKLTLGIIICLYIFSSLREKVINYKTRA